MNQILELYENNDEFTNTEKNLLIDYTERIKSEILKLKILELDQEEAEDEVVQMVQEAKGHNAPPTKISEPIHQEKKVEVTEPIKQAELVSADKVSNNFDSNTNHYPQLFEHLNVQDVYSKLELKPLSDIKLGMGLNEKIQAQNELFNGDKIAFDEIIQSLNQCPDFSSSKNLLCEFVIPKYNWVNPTKEKTVLAFIKLVKRRHL
ncbi:MAG: hypothetical protein ABI851_09885 [Saprospiraceae bacterium]